jgi:diguanylate cyclase
MPTSLKMPRNLLVRVWRRSIIMSVISGAASVLISEAIMRTISAGMNVQGAIAAFLLPLILGGPMMFYLMLRGEQLHYANIQLEVMATTDSLTGTLNRRAFTTKVDQQARTVTDEPLCLLVIDADHFKLINDRFGHPIGDRALQLIASTLRAIATPSNLVGRLGGEEFGVLLRNVGPSQAEHVAETIRRAIADITLDVADGEHPLSASIGCAVAETGARASFGELFRVADRHLYDAKAKGRNSIALGLLSDPEPQARAA